MDKNLREVGEDSLYTNTYLVPQQSFIFKSSLFNNVTMFGDKNLDSEERFKEAISKVNLNQFMVQHGENDLRPEEMSGGEKKRVSIARALYQKPEIIILDEPTADLDPDNKKMINSVIAELDDKTRIVITHDWDESYLKKFNQVIKL